MNCVLLKSINQTERESNLILIYVLLREMSGQRLWPEREQYGSAGDKAQRSCPGAATLYIELLAIGNRVGWHLCTTQASCLEACAFLYMCIPVHSQYEGAVGFGHKIIVISCAGFCLRGPRNLRGFIL